jgi:hypothetical protein
MCCPEQQPVPQALNHRRKELSAVTRFEPDESGMKAFLDHIGEQVRSTVDDTVLETTDQDLDTAVDTLHARLNAIPGLEFDRDWAQTAVETLRRGEPLEIQIG